jgi:hypothetical protein
MSRRLPVPGSLLALAFATVTLAGCGSAPKVRDYTPVAVRFHLESTTGDGAPIALPQSGVGVTLNPKPVLTEGDVVGVELVRVDLGLCLLFQLTPAAARDFYRLSVTHQGRRLVLLLDDAPAGARRLDGPIANGAIYMFVERAEEALPELVANLKKSSAAMQREIARSP